MSTIAARIKHYLDGHKIAYHVFRHVRTDTLLEAARELCVPEAHFARAVVLGDKEGHLLAVLPLNTQIDFSKLNRLTGRNLNIVPRSEMDNLYHDCEPCSHAPLGEPYGLPMVIDRAFLRVPEIYFEPGSHTSLVRLTRDDFHFLTSSALWGNFAVETESALLCTQKKNCDFIWKKIEQFYAFPECPNLATLNPIKLKMTLSEHFEIEKEGALGFNAFWKHASLTAALAHQLALGCQSEMGIDPALAYLAGWSHNVGFLVLGHLFKPEFRALNKLLQLYPKMPMQNVEQKLLGMGHAHQLLGLGHTEMGAWLLKRWDMPAEVIVAATHHHHENYKRKYWPYVRLVFLANHLLSKEGLGEGNRQPASVCQFNELGLDALYICHALEQVLGNQTGCLEEQVALLLAK